MLRFKLFTFLVLFSCSMSQMIGQGVFFSEDFDGGLPDDWTLLEVLGDMSASSNWVYTTTGPAGSFATDPLQSTTADNGWMIFDSDLNCSGGQDAWLISPMIDASDKNVVFLEFESYYRTFNDQSTIQVSSDMVNWEEFIVFPGIAANDFGGGGDNPHQLTINITSAAAGRDTVYVAFRFLSDGTIQNGGNLDGCGYNWQIDDVALTDADPRPANDLEITNFYAVAPNAKTPASQVGAFSFLADIQNVGSAPQTAANLTISITNDDTGNEVFSDQINYTDIEIDEVLENFFFDNSFTPDPSPATYTGSYVLEIDGVEDDIPDNNVENFFFEVTDTTFSKSLSSTTSVRPADSNSYTWGNVYYVPNGAEMYARYLSFGYSDASTIAGQSVTTYVYKWEGDTNESLEAEPEEYAEAPIAFNSYTFDGSEDNQIITIPVDLDGESVLLEDDSYYIVAVEYQAEGTDEINMLASEENDYTNAWFISDSLDMPTQWAGALDVGNTGSFSLVGFGFDIVPVVDLHIGTGPTKTTNLLSEDNIIEVNPNPVDEILFLNMKLTKVAEQVELKVFDVVGKTVLSENYLNFQQGQSTFDVKDWQSGAYFLRVTTPQGMRTHKFIVK